MKMYTIKYTLSSGGKIALVDVQEGAADTTTPVRYVYSLSGFGQQYVVGRDIFLTADEALAAAAAARTKKIAGLSKQIDKLEKMTFSVVEPSP